MDIISNWNTGDISDGFYRLFDNDFLHMVLLVLHNNVITAVCGCLFLLTIVFKFINISVFSIAVFNLDHLRVIEIHTKVENLLLFGRSSNSEFSFFRSSLECFVVDLAEYIIYLGIISNILH